MIILHFLLSLLISSSLAQEAQPRVGQIGIDQQDQVTSRIQSLNLYTFSFGPAWGADMNNNSSFYSIHAGKHWEVATNAEIRLSIDTAMATEGKGNWLSGTLGSAWLVTTDNISPIIGAEFGFGYSHIQHATDPSGFVLGAFAGARFFRTSNAQLSIEAFLQSILDEKHPILSGLRIGILF